MTLFTWSKDQSIHLPEIDAEHRGMVRLGMELHKSVLAGGQVEQVKPILLNLMEAADDHFRHEERLMRVVRYSAFEWHKKQHDTLRKRTRQILQRVEAGDKDAAMELLTFFNKWFADHMSVSDQMLGSFMRNYLRVHTNALAS